MNDIKARLVAKQEELEKRLTNLGKHAGKELDKDSSERAVELENDEVMQKLDIEAREELTAIADALNRIDTGKFGTCVACNEPISPERLDALPFSHKCISCAS